MATPTGTLLAGRYRILERLGTGGMATVFLAEDERLGRRVAVKRMHAESPGDVAKRFRREAQLGAALNHPNIVSIYDIETTGDDVLIVMEYVPGGTLKDALADGPLLQAAALEVLDGLAAGLDHAHAHGVVHRDVKPANVLIDQDGRAKLADLGIATAAEVTSITKTGTVMGTAPYMAPERLDGKPGGPAGDVYALATLAYEMLTGRRARQGRSAVEIARAVMSEPPPDLRVHAPHEPAEAARVLERGMARDPAERPATAGQLAAELSAALARTADDSDRTVPLPADRPRSKRSAHGARRRWLVPVLGLAALLVAVGAVLALRTGDDGQPAGGSASTRDTTAQSTGDGTASTSTPAAVAPPAAETPAAPPPEQVVQDFYTRAAAGDFDRAWALLDPNARAQLGGYDSFVATLDPLESIEFPTLDTTVNSTDRATVTLASVANRTDRVDRCNGTVALARSGGEWRIDSFDVSCDGSRPSGGAPPSQTPGKGPAGGKPTRPGSPGRRWNGRGGDG